MEICSLALFVNPTKYYQKGGSNMKKHLKGIICISFAVTMISAFSGFAFAKSLTVGVSWSNFQEERWKTDEAAIKTQLEKLGAKYISADAQADSSKQISDVENLISRGCDALIILAYDADAGCCGIQSQTGR